ncbi:hypothetical protein [Hydrogenophaga sp.]|uniref:hypothetical protein n=1 Tax=Hydrogenophaga sp. TaxID=1904254 RepID=UPI00263803C9|nr:hypothetical protein [Hydrogenophaga sp.]
MTTTTDKKRCALECASVEEAAQAARRTNEVVVAPCALLDPHADGTPDSSGVQLDVRHVSETEDESADPVGDGRSDAELAARLAGQS